MTDFYPYHFPFRVRWSLHTLCQCVGLALIMFWTSSAGFAASSDYTFTDQEGRALVGKIVSVVQPDVYLQSGAGRPYPVKIGAFSAKDQAYIKQWALDNQKSALPFNIFALKSAVDTSPDELPQQSFQVTLKNISGKSVVNLRVDYVVLRQPSPNFTAPLPRITGSAKITSIVKNEEVGFETDPITAKGSRLAVWVRVYNSQGKLLQEWSSAPALTEAEEWGSLHVGKSKAGAGNYVAEFIPTGKSGVLAPGANHGANR
jgi:hypothetical protein